MGLARGMADRSGMEGGAGSLGGWVRQHLQREEVIDVEKEVVRKNKGTGGGGNYEANKAERTAGAVALRKTKSEKLLKKYDHVNLGDWLKEHSSDGISAVKRPGRKGPFNHMMTVRRSRYGGCCHK